MIVIILQEIIVSQKLDIVLKVGTKKLMVLVVIGQVILELLGNGHTQKVLHYMHNGQQIDIQLLTMLMVVQVQCHKILYIMIAIILQEVIVSQKRDIALQHGTKKLMVLVAIGQVGLEKLGSGHMHIVSHCMHNGKQIHIRLLTMLMVVQVRCHKIL